MQPGKKIISHAEAKAAGLKLYFTGEPCRRGHAAERYVSTRGCVECCRQYHRQRTKAEAEPRAAAMKAILKSWKSRLRAEAKAAGRTRYFTGQPCKHGHVAERMVSSDGCVECLRQHRKAHAATRLERKRKWRRENRERKRETDRRWAQANVAKRLKYERRRYATDPAYRLAFRLRRMLRKMLVGYAGKGTLSHFPEGRVEEVRAKIDADLATIPGAPGSYAEMDGSEWHVDHIVPMSVMFDLLPNEPRPVLAYVASHPDMLRPLPAAENIARGNTLDADAKAALPRFWEIVHEARAYHNDRKELET